MRVSRPTEAVLPEPPLPDVEPAAERGASAHEGPSAFGQVLRGLGRELDRGEALAERAIHGGGAAGGMSPQALIALQAGIFRYSEAVDLVTKLVDRATQAVKTTLQNQ
jgi:glycerate kinase